MTAGLVATVLAAGAVSVPIAHADDLKHRESKVKQRIEHAQGDFDRCGGASLAAARHFPPPPAMLTAASHDGLALARGHHKPMIRATEQPGPASAHRGATGSKRSIFGDMDAFDKWQGDRNFYG